MKVVELYPQPISFELDALNGTSVEFLQTFRLVWAITVLCSVVIKLVHQPCGSLQSSLIAIIQLLLVAAHDHGIILPILQSASTKKSLAMVME